MSETFSYDNLIAGSQQPLVNRPVTVAEGEVLSRGALLGRILRDVPETGTATQGNTGNGTVTDVVGTTKTKIGSYRLVVTQAEDDDYSLPLVVAVHDPDGIRLEDAGEGEYSGAQIGFTVAQGQTPFAVGDTFSIAVTAGSGEAVQAALDATDGSDVPFGILAEDVDGTDAEVLTTCYVRGEFSGAAVGFAEGEDADDWREACAAVGIYLRDTVAA